MLSRHVFVMITVQYSGCGSGCGCGLYTGISSGSGVGTDMLLASDVGIIFGLLLVAISHLTGGFTPLTITCYVPLR